MKCGSEISTNAAAQLCASRSVVPSSSRDDARTGVRSVDVSRSNAGASSLGFCSSTRARASNGSCTFSFTLLPPSSRCLCCDTVAVRDLLPVIRHPVLDIASPLGPDDAVTRTVVVRRLIRVLCGGGGGGRSRACTGWRSRVNCSWTNREMTMEGLARRIMTLLFGPFVFIVIPRSVCTRRPFIILLYS